MKKSEQCLYCKHSFTLVDSFPCNFCAYGNGLHGKNYFQEKENMLTASELRAAVERLKKGGNGHENI